MGQTYSTLNGLRGIAALAVVIYHAKPLWGFDIAPVGYLAVDLFFILSGFVIAHAYDAKLPTMGFRGFVWRRVLRFYPLYLLGMLLGLGVFVAEIVVSPPASLTWVETVAAFALGLLFLPAPFNDDLYALNVPAWTLGMEMAANIIFGALHRFITIHRLIAVVFVAGAALIAAVIENGSAAMGASVDTVVQGIARTLFGFSIGVLIYRSGFRLSVPPITLSLLVSIALLLPISTEWRMAYDLACILIAFPLIVAAGTVDTGRLTGTSEWFGNMSYGTYSIHYPLIWLTLAAATTIGISTSLAGAALILGLLAISGPLHCTDKAVRDWISAR